MNSHNRRRQKGVALVTAMLVTAIATITAVALASRQQLDIRRTENMLERDQAYLFGLGVEEWARQILAQDRRDNNVDHPGESWASILPPITVEGAVVAGSIEDLQGRFNLNNLAKDGQASAPDIQRFQRLLRALDLDEDIARAVTDWIDADEEPAFPDGAEDNEYLLQERPYRTANAPMANASELLLVKGVDYDAYRTLRPYVTALPARTVINVNTAPVPVLMSLAEGLSQGDAELLVEERGETGYENIDDFMNQPPFKGMAEQIPDIGVASDHFLLSADVSFGRSRLQLFSLFARSADAKVQVAMRAQGTW
ncbi:MAG: type II secretion system minor pseudopilin GspK [Gammaproteobacteria bacterium]